MTIMYLVVTSLSNHLVVHFLCLNTCSKQWFALFFAFWHTVTICPAVPHGNVFQTCISKSQGSGLSKLSFRNVGLEMTDDLHWKLISPHPLTRLHLHISPGNWEAEFPAPAGVFASCCYRVLRDAQLRRIFTSRGRKETMIMLNT